MLLSGQCDVKWCLLVSIQQVELSSKSKKSFDKDLFILLYIEKLMYVTFFGCSVSILSNKEKRNFFYFHGAKYCVIITTKRQLKENCVLISEGFYMDLEETLCYLSPTRTAR